MGSSQDSLGSWDERLQLATAMSEVTEADLSVLHEVHERMLDSQRTHNLAQPKFREICFEIWVGPAFTRLFSRFGRSGAQERKRPTFEKNARFAGGLRLQDPRIHSVDR